MPRYTDIPTILPVRARRRRALLLNTLQRASGLDAQVLGPAFDRVPQGKPGETPECVEILPSLLATMKSILQEAGSSQAISDVELASALAQSLVEAALSEVRSEAQRAGHEESFVRLQPWLQVALPEVDAENLAAATRQGTAGLQRALERLRRRFRQRIDSGLALWSAEGEQRQRLRRALHAAASTGGRHEFGS
jgi:hypothetical protein